MSRAFYVASPVWSLSRSTPTMMKSLFAVFLLVLVSGLPCWCRVRDGELNFVVLGDWGGQPTTPYTTPTEREVAAQMGKTAAAVGSKFTLALGDNFYDTGVKDVSDLRFQETFEVGSAAGIGNIHVEFICHLLRMCSQRKLCRAVGTLCVETTTTMAMRRQKWHTPRYLSDGTCLSCTTLR